MQNRWVVRLMFIFHVFVLPIIKNNLFINLSVFLTSPWQIVNNKMFYFISCLIPWLVCKIRLFKHNWFNVIPCLTFFPPCRLANCFETLCEPLFSLPASHKIWEDEILVTNGGILNWIWSLSVCRQKKIRESL